MNGLFSIESQLDQSPSSSRLLSIAEKILEDWIVARGGQPTHETSEGFRLLALHRQGARGVPSFNACRETCREVVFHRNLLTTGMDEKTTHEKTLKMMTMLVRHLALFVYGKLEAEGLGEFCCSSRSLRLESPAEKTGSASHG